MADVLVVADETWVLDDVRSALGESRYHVREATDPRTVVDEVRASGPDVIVVDLQIGSMGGMALTRAVRQAFGDDPPPVVMLLDRDADAFLAGRSGATGWVRKPFGAGDLRSAIDAAVA